jgi:hypothetical protein
LAYDGSGTFNRIHNWQQDAANGIDISAPEMDGEDNGFAAGLTLAVTRDGQGKMAADFVPAAPATYSLGTAGVPWLNVAAKSGAIGPPAAGVAWTATGIANSYAMLIIGSSAAGQSAGLRVVAGTNGDGGVVLGAPVGADKGLGSINAISAFLNGVQIYAGVPINAQTANYVLALTDANTCVPQNTAGDSITVPTNASVPFPPGTVISIYNGSAGNISIPTAGDTVRFGPTSASGTRTLAQNGLATLFKLTATIWVITGSGLS